MEFRPEPGRHNFVFDENRCFRRFFLSGRSLPNLLGIARAGPGRKSDGSSDSRRIVSFTDPIRAEIPNAPPPCSRSWTAPPTDFRRAPVELPQKGRTIGPSCGETIELCA